MTDQAENATSYPSQKNIQVNQSEILRVKVESQQNKLLKQKEKVTELQKVVENLKQQRANKISSIDDLNRIIKKLKDHQAMLPMIKELRAHYKKLREHLGPQSQDIDVDQMSYEQLLELGDKIGKVSKGISQQQFLGLERQCCMINQQCSICQDDLTLGAQCIKLKCGHMYDIQCLKQWVKMEKVCPLCKVEII